MWSKLILVIPLGGRLTLLVKYSHVNPSIVTYGGEKKNPHEDHNVFNHQWQPTLANKCLLGDESKLF